MLCKCKIQLYVCSSFLTGNISEAQRILEALEMAMPGLAVVRIRRAGLERRVGRLDKAESLLREAVEENKDKPHLHAFYSIKLARFLHKLAKNLSRARTVLQEAIEISPVSKCGIFGGLFGSTYICCTYISR